MTFADLDKGDKTDLHVALYRSELALLDALCARYNCSRAAALGALLREHGASDLVGDVPTSAAAVAARSRRRT